MRDPFPIAPANRNRAQLIDAAYSRLAPHQKPSPTPALRMSKLPAFKRPWDGFEELEELLRAFYAEEREA